MQAIKQIIPNSEDCEKFLKLLGIFSQNKSYKNTVRVILFGNGSNGKTTLISGIPNIKKQFSPVDGVDIYALGNLEIVERNNSYVCISSEELFVINIECPNKFNDSDFKMPEIDLTKYIDDAKFTQINDRYELCRYIGHDGIEYKNHGWYKDGKLHRDDGMPAYDNGVTQMWYDEGILHREDGKPAVIDINGREEYWDDGNRIYFSKEEAAKDLDKYDWSKGIVILPTK